jgi:PTH2 family peptidyl-tRNA hydrolase
MSDIKQVICVRRDLNMRKGKMIVQGCHASVQVCLRLQADWDPDYGFRESPRGQIFEQWLGGLQTKICVGVNSEDELVDIYNKAKAAGLPCSIITDAGKTEFNGVPTKTTCAIGPADSLEIDKITGHMSLL